VLKDFKFVKVWIGPNAGTSKKGGWKMQCLFRSKPLISGQKKESLEVPGSFIERGGKHLDLKKRNKRLTWQKVVKQMKDQGQ
jgi:hypothetical protein